MKVTKIFQWDAAHQLALPYKSKCLNMHGHTYKVEVELEGDLNEEGMVVDFARIKEVVQPASFDHQCISKVACPKCGETVIGGIEWFEKHGKNPTAENCVLFIKEILDATWKPFYPKIRRIRVWETPTSYAEEVFGEDIAPTIQKFVESSKKMDLMNTALENANKKLLALAKKLR